MSKHKSEYYKLSNDHLSYHEFQELRNFRNFVISGTS